MRHLGASGRKLKTGLQMYICLLCTGCPAALCSRLARASFINTMDTTPLHFDISKWGGVDRYRVGFFTGPIRLHCAYGCVHLPQIPSGRTRPAWRNRRQYLRSFAVHCSSNRDGVAPNLAATLQRLCSELAGCRSVSSHAESSLRDF
ncbi:hypothetical protein K432DRAFT_212456 [Lepidopterella palustris CBS 459.81]|uniref:Secreted protein n=1 Tax=Lepidopterella palustris CBS 459.81 TaxID=1314670 RepID=A0A8E2EF91_9PEZI|nr:hypothetical protein K432DRAFT_212456 [Lepidopterella palustris CBS 459.81]